MAVIRSVKYQNLGVVADGSFFFEARSIEAWIDGLCLRRGSTLAGRRKAFTVLTGQKQKVPVYVDPSLILVPLCAADDLEGEWVNWCQCPTRVPEKTSRNIRQFLRAIEAPLLPECGDV